MSRISLPVTAIGFVLWIVITVAGSRIMTGGQAELGDGLRHGIDWPILAAAAFILAFTLWQGRPGDTGLRPIQTPGTLRLAWLPLLYVAAALGFTAIAGLPPATVIFWVLLNAMIVGFSEELMFRGVILRSLRARLAIWPAVIVTSLLFGSVHSLNILTTGEVAQSLIQSVGAALTGLMFMALRLRTGALWPAMVLHGLWDFGTFTLGSTGGDGGPAEDPGLLLMASPVLVILPVALYGLYLLRNIGRDNADPTT